MQSLGEPRFARIDGTLLHWADRGHGRPVVFLHGLADHHHTWRRVVPQLSRHRYRILMPDLAGHGLSSRPDASYTLDWHAKVIGNWIDSLGIDTFDLVGHSFGGGVAQMLLLTHGDRIGRVGLVAPGGLGREVAWAIRLLALPGASEAIRPFLGLGTRIALSLSPAISSDKDECEQAAWLNSRPGTAEAFHRTAHGIADLGGQRRHFLDQAACIGRIPPVGMFWGSQDPIIPVKHGSNALRLIRDARLTVFQGCGHFPQLEVPTPFSGALSAFLEDSSLRATRIAVPPGLPARMPWWKRFARAVGRLAGCAVPRARAA